MKEKEMEPGMYQVIDAGDGIWLIDEGEVRSFLVAGSEKALLIDSGFHIPDLRGVAEGLTDLPLLLANTHADGDHIGANGQFEEAYMHPSEYAFYHRRSAEKEAGTDDACKTHLRPLWEGDILSLGGRDVEVVFQPGHTQGSVSFLDRKTRTLIGGDGIQDGGIFMFGAHRDILAYLHTLERMERCMDRFERIFPSHGTCPLKPEIIPCLAKGVRNMLAGNMAFEREDWNGVPIRVFDIGCAKILYEGEKTLFV